MRGLMRGFWAAVAVMGLALAGTARAQDALSPVDIPFYGAVAEQTVGDARTGEDVAWSANGRSGTIQFSAADGPCKTFFIAETAPERRPPAIGTVCPRTGATGRYEASNIRAAASAGPRGEPPRTFGSANPPSAPPSPADPSVGAGGGTRSIGGATGATRSLGNRPVTDVRIRFVLLNRSQVRLDNAGGHAVVLMRSPQQAPNAQVRNRRLCEAIQRQIETRTYAQAEIGLEALGNGRYAEIRPLFWLLKDTSGGPGCDQRVRDYDFVRAAAIMDKAGLRNAGEGPFIVVSRDDQTAGATIDMTMLTNAQIDPMVQYFRERFGQKADVWSPAVNTVSFRRQSLSEVFRDQFTDGLVRSISTFTAPRNLGACVGDPRDETPCAR